MSDTTTTTNPETETKTKTPSARLSVLSFFPTLLNKLLGPSGKVTVSWEYDKEKFGYRCNFESLDSEGNSTKDWAEHKRMLADRLVKMLVLNTSQETSPFDMIMISTLAKIVFGGDEYDEIIKEAEALAAYAAERGMDDDEDESDEND